MLMNNIQVKENEIAGNTAIIAYEFIEEYFLYWTYMSALSRIMGATGTGKTTVKTLAMT